MASKVFISSGFVSKELLKDKLESDWEIFCPTEGGMAKIWLLDSEERLLTEGGVDIRFLDY